MIYRKFDNLKFKRTYINGTKRAELKAFEVVQGSKEDNSECDWIKYRSILKEYCDDKLNILLSWIYVVKNLTLVLAVIGVLVAGANIIIGVLTLVIAGIIQLVHIYLKKVELKILTEYDFSLNIINQQTGLSLSNN